MMCIEFHKTSNQDASFSKTVAYFLFRIIMINTVYCKYVNLKLFYFYWLFDF